MVEIDRLPGRQSGDHRGGTGRLNAEHGGVGGALREIGGDPGDAATATDGDDDQIRFGVQLIEDLHGDGALPGDGPRIVVGRDQGRAGAGHIGDRGRGGVVVGGSADDHLDVLAAVIPDPVALLFRSLRRDVDASVHLHGPAGQRETLGVVTRRGADHTGSQFVVGELLEQVVGAAQLVGPHALQVLALEVDVGAGGLRQPVAVLQRGPGSEIGDPHGSLVNVGRGDRRRHAAPAQVSGHRIMVPPISANQ